MTRKLNWQTVMFGLAMLVVNSSLPADSHEGARTGADILVWAAWSRASLPGSRNGVIYMKIENPSDREITLVGATSSRARSVTLHESKLVNDMMRMRMVKALTLAPISTTVLEPRGLHFMMKGLADPLAEGELFSLTLKYQNPEPVEVDVQVKVGSLGSMSFPES